jgi:hypothetical protein
MSSLVISITSNNPEPAFLHEKLLSKGHDSFFLDLSSYPFPFEFVWSQEGSACCKLRDKQSGQTIALDSVRSVFHQTCFDFMTIGQFQGCQDPWTMLEDVKSALGTFLFSLPKHCQWLDPIPAHEFHLYKSLQLPLIEALGIHTPKTIVTTHPDSIREFFHAHSGQVIIKPCSSFSYTKLLTKMNLKQEALESLCKVPVTVQEYIPGLDILVFVVGGQVFGAEIDKVRTVDYRQSESVLYRPVNLPDRLIAQCLQITKAIGSNFSGLDFKRTETGEYVFIEANPAPIFLHFEKATGYPITEALLQTMIEPELPKEEFNSQLRQELLF